MKYTYVYKCSIRKVSNENDGLRNGLWSRTINRLELDEKKEITNPFQKSMGRRISAIFELKFN